LYTVDREDEAMSWEVFQVRVLPDIRHATKGTRVGHARVVSVSDQNDSWDANYDNLDVSQEEALVRCNRSNNSIL
jgi:hypothetical protein